MTDYPNEPGYRRNAPETSREAAESMSKAAATIRAKVLTIVERSGPDGVIGDDVAESLELHVTQVRSRISELHKAGKIADSKRRREGKSGRRGSVWVLPVYAPPEPDGPQGDLMDAA